MTVKALVHHPVLCGPLNSIMIYVLNDVPSKSLTKHSSLMISRVLELKFLWTGDFNAEKTDHQLETFLYQYELKSDLKRKVSKVYWIQVL